MPMSALIAPLIRFQHHSHYGRMRCGEVIPIAGRVCLTCCLQPLYQPDIDQGLGFDAANAGLFLDAPVHIWL